MLGMFHTTWKNPSRDEETEYGRKTVAAEAECALSSPAQKSNGSGTECMLVQPGGVGTLILPSFSLSCLVNTAAL